MSMEEEQDARRVCKFKWHYSGISVAADEIVHFGLTKGNNLLFSNVRKIYMNRALRAPPPMLYPVLFIHTWWRVGSLTKWCVGVNKPKNMHLSQFNVNRVDGDGLTVCSCAYILHVCIYKCMPLWTSLVFVWVFGCVRTTIGERSDSVVGEHVWDNRRNSSRIYCMTPSV